MEKAIGAAKSEILVAAYEFTSRDIAEQQPRHTAGSRSESLPTGDHAGPIRPGARTRGRGDPVRLNRLYAIMHNKFLVIDGDTVETGSFDYTTAANKHNAENALVLWNVPQIAELYAREWERLWEESDSGSDMSNKNWSWA